MRLFKISCILPLTNYQVMPTQKYSHVHVLTFQKLGKLKKGRTENNVKVRKIIFLCNLRPRNFHIPEK